MKKSTKNHLKSILIVALTFVVMFVGSKAVFGTENPFYLVSSGSMTPALRVYDVIVVQENVPFDHIRVGDIIAFRSPNAHDEIIVHRVAQILNQNPFEIRTMGDANRDSIPGIDLPITQDDYIGKVSYVIPQIGYLTQILAPPMNYVMVASIMGLIAIRPYLSAEMKK